MNRTAQQWDAYEEDREYLEGCARSLCRDLTALVEACSEMSTGDILTACLDATRNVDRDNDGVPDYEQMIDAVIAYLARLQLRRMMRTGRAP